MSKILFRYSQLLLCQFLWLACASQPSPKVNEKPYENCICGPTYDANGNAQCAIWNEGKNSGKATKVWQSQAQNSCEPKDCSLLFSKFCQKIQMWPHPLQTQTTVQDNQNCYCDQLLIENEKGQIQLQCAAWVEGAKQLLEYYSLEDCSPTRCQNPPFQRSAKICGARFKAFYPPLLNHN
ncbi:MAG: hypothetical protein NTX25_22005 [Proteobacteria bacterium]|nr:hypothetical protein [Pseudomonadota bacterium]